MTESTSPLRVLARPAFSRSNPYTALVYRDLGRYGARVVEWTAWRALLGTWDVLHVHWPETVFDHRLIEAVAGSTALLAAVDRARARGARLVWTIHNLHAHGKRHPAAEARFRERWIERLDGVIALSRSGLDAAVEAMPALAAKPARVVAHPHYRGVYPDAVDRGTARERLGLPADARVLAFFGRIAPYKGLPELVEAFGSLADTRARLVIAGPPFDAELALDLVRSARDDPRVIVRPGFVPDDEVQLVLRASDASVVPFRNILNSGSVILALSLDRPVLAPRIGALVELADAIAPGWLRLYDGAITPAALEGMLAAAAELPERTRGEHLATLDPAAIGRQTYDAFRAFASGGVR
jgi:glycosyltransferase involved in cell wall biosynthesis